MKPFVKHYSLILFSIILVACGNQSKKDTQKKTNEIQTTLEVEHKIIFENDYAKVAKVSLAPGESLKPHQGEKRIIYALTDYTIDWEEQGEKLGAKTWKTGDVHYHKPGKHTATNNGTTTAEWLVFVKKNENLPDCDKNTVENDVTSVLPDDAKTLFENDDFKITEVILAKGKSVPMHAGINRIIYSLSDYQILYDSDKEEKKVKQFKKGDVHWHEACVHALENKGDREAKFLVVSYKKNN